MPRLTGWHKHDLIKVKSICYFASCHQVTIVDWVESSTHHPNAHSLIGHEEN